METKVLDQGILKISKSFFAATREEELAGWASGHSYFTVEEGESLYLLLPHLLEEMREKKKGRSRSE